MDNTRRLTLRLRDDHPVDEKILDLLARLTSDSARGEELRMYVRIGFESFHRGTPVEEVLEQELPSNLSRILNKLMRKPASIPSELNGSHPRASELEPAVSRQSGGEFSATEIPVLKDRVEAPSRQELDTSASENNAGFADNFDHSTPQIEPAAELSKNNEQDTQSGLNERRGSDDTEAAPAAVEEDDFLSQAGLSPKPKSVGVFEGGVGALSALNGLKIV